MHPAVDVGIVIWLALLGIGIQVDQVRCGEVEGGIGQASSARTKTILKLLPLHAVESVIHPIEKTLAVGIFLRPFKECALVQHRRSLGHWGLPTQPNGLGW